MTLVQSLNIKTENCIKTHHHVIVSKRVALISDSCSEQWPGCLYEVMTLFFLVQIACTWCFRHLAGLQIICFMRFIKFAWWARLSRVSPIVQEQSVSPHHTLKYRHVETLSVSTCCGRKDLSITSNDCGYWVLGREKMDLYSPTSDNRWLIW